MGYRNKDFSLVVYKPKSKKKAKQNVTRLARRALRREINGEHPKKAARATRRGWWFA